MEENAGINFPGSSMEIYRSKSYKDINKASNAINGNYDLLVIE